MDALKAVGDQRLEKSPLILPVRKDTDPRQGHQESQLVGNEVQDVTDMLPEKIRCLPAAQGGSPELASLMVLAHCSGHCVRNLT